MMDEKTISFTEKGGEYLLQYRKSAAGGDAYESHFHPKYEFIMVLGGTIEGVIEEKQYRLTKGGLLVVPPYRYHNVSVLPEGAYERITLLFDDGLIPEELKESFQTFAVQTPVVVGERVKECIRRISTAFLPPYENYRDYAAGLVAELFYCAFSEENAYRVFEADEKIRRISEYIEAHLGEKILLDDLAAKVFLSKSGICHLFKKEMQISIKQYILQKKIAYAAALLSAGVPALEAAYRVGYDNYANFYKTYKKISGRAPSEEK